MTIEYHEIRKNIMKQYNVYVKQRRLTAENIWWMEKRLVFFPKPFPIFHGQIHFQIAKWKLLAYFAD